MDTLAPAFCVTRNDHLREVHYTLAGFFSADDIEALFAELLRVARPFMDDRKGFRVLGDLREFKVQTREIGERMRESQEVSAKVGVTRMAIVYSSILQMQQLRRVSEGLTMGYFEDKTEALAWLRED